MVISIFMICAGMIGLCVLLYRFAVYALPAAIGIWMASLIFQANAGMIAAFVAGVLAGGAVFALAQLFYAVARPLPLRLLVLLMFVTPAAYMGHSMVLQLTELGTAAPFWREFFAIIGAIAVASSAAARLSPPRRLHGYRPTRAAIQT